MAEQKHTEGPWRFDGTGKLQGRNGQAVCTLPNYDASEGPQDKAEQEATQRLLASAPDLLAALESVELFLFRCEGNGGSTEGQNTTLGDHIATTRAAIAKATGQEATA